MALFKIYNNIDNPRKNEQNEPILPDTYNKGYMYFDAQTKRFFIDLAGDGGSTGTRVAVNAYGAERSYSDWNGDRIDTTYLKTANVSNYMTQVSLVEWNDIYA